MMSIEFLAEVIRVGTLADGGIRVTLDLPETAVPEAALLMDCKRRGLFLSLVPTEQGLEARPEASWSGAERHWRGPEPQESIANEG
jgi:hypothetical protein